MADEHFTFPTRNAAIHFDEDKDYSKDHRAADEDYNQFVLEDWLNRRLAVLPSGDSLWTDDGDLYPTAAPTFSFIVTAGDDVRFTAGDDFTVNATDDVILNAGGSIDLAATAVVNINATASIILTGGAVYITLSGLPGIDPGSPGQLYQVGGVLMVSL